MEIAGEMEVDVLHRQDLRVAAAGGAALDAEAGAEAGFAQGDHGFGADAVQRVAEADGGGGLALAGRGWGDAGDQDQGAVRFGIHRTDKIPLDLGLGLAVGDQGVGGDAGAGGDLGDGADCGGAGDFEVGAHGGQNSEACQGKGSFLKKRTKKLLSICAGASC